MVVQQDMVVNWWSWAIPSSIAIIFVAITGAIYAFGVWKGRVESEVSTLKELMNEIRDDIKRIFRQLGPAVIDSQSPVELTGLGDAISEELEAREWAKLTAPHLINRISERAREFEIYEICEKYVHDEFQPSEEMLVRMREVAYAHGIEVAKVLDVFSVELRNRILEQVSAHSSSTLGL